MTDHHDEAEPQRVLFVHAHPDDETISTGAAIATLVESGAHVTVLTCTRGELGEVIPVELQHLSPAALGAHRLRELDTALAALGVTDHRILGKEDARWQGREPRRYFDSGMRWGPKGPLPLEFPDPRSLCAADLGEVAADIAAVMLAVRPHVVVSYAADGGYGHPDHVRIHEATRAAAEVLHIAFYVVDTEGTQRGPVVVDPAPVLDRKREALEAHATQVTVDADTFSLSSGAPHPISVIESFTRVRQAAPSFRDHSLISRIATFVVAALLGLFAGATLTAAHQATVSVAGVAVPWGLVVGLLIVAALFVGLRLAFETRWVAVSAAAGLLAAAALFAIQSRGGSVLVPANLAGYVWTFAPVLIVGLVLGWPKLTRPNRTATRDNIELPAVKGPERL